MNRSIFCGIKENLPVFHFTFFKFKSLIVYFYLSKIQMIFFKKTRNLTLRREIRLLIFFTLPPSSISCLLFTAEPSFSIFGVNNRICIMRTSWHMIDFLSICIGNISFYVTSFIRINFINNRNYWL